MINRDKAYSFILTWSGKDTILVRRVEIPKGQLHAGLVAAVLFVGVVSLGIAGAVTGEVLAKTEAPDSAFASVKSSAAAGDMSGANGETQNVFAQNSGGPSLSDEQEAPEDDVALTGIEGRIRQIELLADPAYLPAEWAHRGKINNEFGFRRNPFGGRSYEFHAGMDIDGERGDSVNAPGNGVVIKAGWSGGYGNMVEIDHGYGITTRYGHLSKIDVKAGESVARGQLIGTVGSTGRSTGPHLHYELRLEDKAINPRLLLPSVSAVVDE